MPDMMICGRCIREEVRFEGLTAQQKEALQHLYDIHTEYVKLRGAVHAAATAAGPGGWPKITDWVEVKRLAGVPPTL